MALDKFINSVRTEVAKRFNLKTDTEIDAFFIGMGESAKEFQEALEKRDKMLRDTVAELCEAKRLLKAAVEDIHKKCSCECSHYKGRDCDICVNEITCDYDSRFQWVLEAEALNLIGESNDEP